MDYATEISKVTQELIAIFEDINNGLCDIEVSVPLVQEPTEIDEEFWAVLTVLDDF